ncbi:hypothetical protein [Brevundimonas sp. Root1423]|uniref:hypothetical protein n=1 Tax=Brevundimonas sp. Root1423 TaxID=1736462 RepID=UPI0006FD4EF8|nr:hypothetical protein [Brevundimonas sp. Root1423]KQY80455.1 hypothetical protein ASD25_10025 [Brevundimonas sp. Root1423]
MTDAPLANTDPHRTPKGPRPRKPRDPDAPAHYRLSKETWELILAEYREGATVTFLSSKWRVSAHALRKRITKHKATKRDWGDAQAMEQAAAREAELEEARRNTPEARAARLFDDMESEPPEAGDPVALARLAAMASGRAMRGRLWAEAKALTALAESYQRMAGQEQAREAGTLETLPLSAVFNVTMASDERLMARFHISERPGVKDPDRDLKEGWWQLRRHREQLEEAQMGWVGDQARHIQRLEGMLRAAGLTPPEFALPAQVARAVEMLQRR